MMTVTASGSATVLSTQYHGPGAEVKLSGPLSAHVDRRGGVLKLSGAQGPA